MSTIYLAHPYFANTREEMLLNRKNAAKWGIWIASTFGVAVSADWLWWTEILEETSENRELGLRCDDQSIAACNEFWMAGGRISSGMQRGQIVAYHHGLLVRNLTQFGFAAPVLSTPELDEFVKKTRANLRVKGLIS